MVADVCSSSAMPWSWGGFRTQKVQPLGSCASEPCDGCACLYLRLDAEGTFSNTEQTTETTTYPPPFLRVKIHFFFWHPMHYWPCLCSSRRYHCWKQLELSNSTGKGSGNHLWLGLDLVFQFLSDVGHLCRHAHRWDRYLPGDITCLPPKPVRLGERCARVCLPLG